MARRAGKRSSGTQPYHGWRVKRAHPLYLMMLPAAVGMLLFNYFPMYGIVLAFQRFNPLLGVLKSPWVGLRNFRVMFAMPDMGELLRNTLAIAIGKIVVGQLASLCFALLLNQITVPWYKRTIQSLSYLLHFVSWVIFGGILIDILGLHGIVNKTLGLIGVKPIFFLGQAKLFYPTAILTGVWKEFGWGAVIYIAALTGVDPTLYDAAAVDGAGRWQQLWNITLPSIASTIALMAALNLGSVLDAGFEQILVLQNPAIYRTSDIIDTWVYRTGLRGFEYSLGTAVGLLKGVVSLVLIVLSYYLADRLANYRIF